MKKNQVFSGSLTLQLAFLSLIVLIITTTVVLCDRQAAGRRLEGPGKSRSTVFQSSCGTSEEVAKKIGECLVPILQLVEGKFPSPKDDNDLIENCNRFNTTEKCIRGVTRDCLSGLHKTAVGTVATAAKRYRANECKNAAIRAKSMEALKCANKKGKEMEAVWMNMTGIAQAVKELPISAEEKLMRNCCVLELLDKEMETRYNRDCPKAAPVILGITHALTDDIKSTLCVRPKCQHALDGLMKSQYKPGQNFLEPVMQVIFMLNTSE